MTLNMPMVTAALLSRRFFRACSLRCKPQSNRGNKKRRRRSEKRKRRGERRAEGGTNKKYRFVFRVLVRGLHDEANLLEALAQLLEAPLVDEGLEGLVAWDEGALLAYRGSGLRVEVEKRYKSYI